MTLLLHIHSCSLLFLSIVSDYSALLFTDIFKEGIWKETETVKDYICRASLQGSICLFCQQGLRKLLREF